MANTEIFAAESLLGVCKAWQEVVDHAPAGNEKKAAGATALRTIAAFDGLNGTHNVIVKTNVALMIRDSYDPEALWNVIEFNNVVAKGWLGRVAYVGVNQQNSIAWPLYDAEVINASEVEVTAEDMLDENVHHLPLDRIRKPLYLPVGFIDMALCAA